MGEIKISSHGLQLREGERDGSRKRRQRRSAGRQTRGVAGVNRRHLCRRQPGIVESAWRSGVFGARQAPQAPPRPKSSQQAGPTSSDSASQQPPGKNSNSQSLRAARKPGGSEARLYRQNNRQYRTLCLVPVGFLTHVRASLHSPLQASNYARASAAAAAPTPKPLRNCVHSFRCE